MEIGPMTTQGVPYQGCSLNSQFMPFTPSREDLDNWEIEFLRLRNAIRRHSPFHPILTIHHKVFRLGWVASLTPQEMIDNLIERTSLA